MINLRESHRILAHRSWLRTIPVLLTITTIAYLFATLGRGHFFNEDYAVYLQEAWNIGHHVPTQDMGVIEYTDPARLISRQSPLTYPPLLPLLYAVPVLYFGFNLMLFKIIQLGLLAAGLLLFCYAMQLWRFSVLEISISIVAFALSYDVRHAVNSIGTDLPLIFFLILALLSIQKFIEATGRDLYLWGVAAGIAIFLAIEMRTVAVALFPTLLIADLLARRRLRLLGLAVPVVTAVLLKIGEYLVLNPGFHYGWVARYEFFTPLQNLKQFYWALFVPMTESAFPGVAQAALAILVVFAAIGLLYEAAKGVVIAVFIIAYTALLLVLPNFDAGARFLVPHLLVLGAFAIRGATLIGGMVIRGRGLGQILRVGVAAIALLWCAVMPSPLPTGVWGFGAMAAPARETFAFVQEHTPPGAVVAATNYRSFHLFTQRTTIRIPTDPSPQELAQWLRRFNVAAVVVKHSPPALKFDFSDCPDLPLCRADALDGQVREVFQNSDFTVFAVEPAGDAPPALPRPTPN